MTTRNHASPYVELFELASGGMGTVRLAIRDQSGFERIYAMKRLLPHMAQEQVIREMFLSEAQFAGLLRHPNVVSVLDFGIDPVGPYLIMDWIEGVPLHRFIQATSREGPMPTALAFGIAAQICRGLHAAHELVTHSGESVELVHRDVTPQNILLGFDGLARVTDFGIAKALGDPDSKATTTGVLKGKVGYMSPEQLRFESIDRRSDLFSLGVVIFEMLSGKRLYHSKASELSVPQQILRGPPPCIGDVRRDVSPLAEELLLELLSKQPADRPASAIEVAERLDELVEAEGETGGSSTLSAYLQAQFAGEREQMRQRIAVAIQEYRERPTGRRWTRIALMVAVITLAGVGAAFAALQAEPAEVAPVQSEPAMPPPPAASPPTDEEEGDDSAEVEVEPDLDEAEAEPTKRRLRRRRRPRRSRMQPTSKGVPRPGEGGWN